MSALSGLPDHVKRALDVLTAERAALHPKLGSLTLAQLRATIGRDCIGCSVGKVPSDQGSDYCADCILGDRGPA